MRSWLPLPLALLALAGCSQQEGGSSARRDEPGKQAAPVQEAPSAQCGTDCGHAHAAPQAVQVGPVRHYGAPPSIDTEAVPVEQVLAAPEPLLGKTIKTEGKVARVCRAAGCWLELQATSDGEGLRVPMANHAFFIPQDAVGQHATIEGELKRRELPQAQKDHYAGEGMKAMGPLSLEAVSVALR